MLNKPSEETALKVLVIGSGGREHALVWKLKSSPRVSDIFVAPGNGGTAAIAQNLDIDPTDFPRLLDAMNSNNIDLVVVGPEGPLAAGIVDEFQSRMIPVFGPSRVAAQLESSKSFARDIMEKYAIPWPKGNHSPITLKLRLTSLNKVFRWSLKLTGWLPAKAYMCVRVWLKPKPPWPISWTPGSSVMPDLKQS